MMQRIWTLYTVELMKALRLKSTYIGPMLMVVIVLASAFLHGIERDGVSDYDFIGAATPAALDIFGPLLVLIYAAALMSSELSSGTIRMVLIRPVLRLEFLSAKLLLGMTYAAVLAVLAAVTSWGAALALGELSGVSYGGEIVYTNGEMGATYVLAMLAALLPLWAAAAFALMLSSLTRNSSAAISSAIGIGFAIEMLKYPLGIAPFFFSTYIGAPWSVFHDKCDALDAGWFPWLGYSLVTSGVSMAVFVSVAAVAIRRRDLHA